MTQKKTQPVRVMQSDLGATVQLYTVSVGSATSHWECESYYAKTLLAVMNTALFPSPVK